MKMDVSHLSYRYPGAARDALVDVSASFPPGRIHALVGPNGSGKTTLLKSLAGLLPGTTPTPDCATLLQESFVPLDMTVFEFVLCGRYRHIPFFGQPSALDRQTVQETLVRCGIACWSEAALGTLSTGQRQLVRLAQVLVEKMPALLLDEPTTFLDLAVQERMFAILRDYLRDAAMTVVLSIHDLHAAGRFCDNLVMMREGRILHVGTPADVLTSVHVREVFDVTAW